MIEHVAERVAELIREEWVEMNEVPSLARTEQIVWSVLQDERYPTVHPVEVRHTAAMVRCGELMKMRDEQHRFAIALEERAEEELLGRGRDDDERG